MLKAYATSRSLRLVQFNPLAGVSAEVVERGLPVAGSGAEVVDRGLFVRDPTANVAVATIWGPVWNLNSWPALLAKADAVMLVLDPQIAREAPDRECVATLMSLPVATRVGCVVWTKQDLVERGVAIVSKAMVGGTSAEYWRTFATRFDDAVRLLEPIEWLVGEVTKSAPAV